MGRANTVCCWGLALLGIGAGLVGCGGHKGRAAGAENAIAHFNPSQVNASFRALDTAAEADPAHTRQAAIARIGDHNPGVRYAALYALSLTVVPGTSTTTLESALRSRSLSERLLAARSLLAHGDKRAIPALINALTERFVPAFGNPPEPAWEVARFDLVQYVPVDLGLIGRDANARAARAAASRWRAWWAAHGDALRWDKTARVYRLR